MDRHDPRRGIHARKFARWDPGAQEVFQATNFSKSSGGRCLGNRLILCNRGDRDQRTHVHLRPFHDDRLRLPR